MDVNLRVYFVTNNVIFAICELCETYLEVRECILKCTSTELNDEVGLTWVRYTPIIPILGLV